MNTIKKLAKFFWTDRKNNIHTCERTIEEDGDDIIETLHFGSIDELCSFADAMCRNENE